MKKSVLLQTIETPNGDTAAYEIISSILESKADDLWDVCRSDARMYSEALSHLNQLMEET